MKFDSLCSAGEVPAPGSRRFCTMLRWRGRGLSDAVDGSVALLVFQMMQPLFHVAHDLLDIRAQQTQLDPHVLLGYAQRGLDRGTQDHAERERNRQTGDFYQSRQHDRLLWSSHARLPTPRALTGPEQTL